MKKTTKRNQKRKGFTLVELIAVMAILGILALLVIPRFADMSENAKVKVFENSSRTLASNVAMYAATHNGDIPTSGNITDLTNLMPGDWSIRLGAAPNNITVDIDDTARTLTTKWLSTSGTTHQIVYNMLTSVSTYTHNP